MMASIFIEPHERVEAIEAYRDRLTPEQAEEIANAPDGAIVQLRFGIGFDGAGTQITIIEEG